MRGFAEGVISTFRSLQAEAHRSEATVSFANEMLAELKPLSDHLDGKTVSGVHMGKVSIPDRAILWLLEPIDQQISSLNSIMPGAGLLDNSRAQFKGTAQATLWELLQLHFKLSVHVIPRADGIHGLGK